MPAVGVGSVPSLWASVKGRPLRGGCFSFLRLGILEQPRDRASAYASAISEALPECTQVADRFHLMQNLLDKMKDIFKNEIPATIFIKDGAVLDKPPKRKSGRRGLTGICWMVFPMIIRHRLMKMELKLNSRARSGTSTASSIRRMPVTGKKTAIDT